jgi:tetratricopeptide (TPR) repeat protein
VKTGAYAEARALYERALAIAEKAVGPEHLSIPVSLINIASIDLAVERPQDARPLLERALTIYNAHEGRQNGETEAQFLVAKALVATHGDRARALALAGEARAGFRERGDVGMLAEVEQFLVEQETGP